MNSKQFNGGLIGNGAQDNRAFLTLTTAAHALSSILLIAYRYLVGTITGRETSTTTIAGTVYMAPSTTCVATSDIDIVGQGQKPFDGLGTNGVATSSTALTARIPVAGTIPCAASSTTAIGGVLRFSGSTLARATSAMQLLATGFIAPNERTMSIPYEDRTMVVQ